MTTSLQFCFKGNRTYVQGPDIVKALYDYLPLPTISAIDLKFNGITSTNLDLVKGNFALDPKVNVRVTENAVDTHYQLVENGENIECHYQYDEDSLIQNSELDIDSQQIHLKKITGYTLCENFVAMNKHLLESLFLSEKGKWYFTRLEQSVFIADDSLITVRLVKNFNFRLTKSDILLGDQVIGSVYFTMVRE
jgi:hypothetical protein